MGRKFGSSSGVSIVSDEEFRGMVALSRSYADLAIRLGYKERSGFLTLKKRMERLGLLGLHFTKSGRREPDSSVFRKGSNKDSYFLRVRALKGGLIDYVCGVCKRGPEWENKSLSLQLDHKDGDKTNNELSNLRFLCPNCHSQTSTYGARNKGTNKRNKINEIPISTLLEVVKKSRSVNQALTLLGCSSKSASYSSFYSRVKREGVDLTHFYWEGSNKGASLRHRLPLGECVQCGKPCSEIGKRCKGCHNLRKRKVKERPSLDALRALLLDFSYEELGRRYGITGNAIKRWFILAGEAPPRKHCKKV